MRISTFGNSFLHDLLAIMLQAQKTTMVVTVFKSMSKTYTILPLRKAEKNAGGTAYVAKFDSQHHKRKKNTVVNTV